VPEPFLSIIIPAHNEDYACEVIVVENGSTDHTVEVVEEFQDRLPYLQLIQSVRRGKGLAVKLGMLAATGQFRFLADADLSMPIEEVVNFIPPKLAEFDIAIASRELKDSRRIDEPGYRHLVGRVFNALVRWLALPGLNDTQCGFKCFSAQVAQAVFPQQTLEGMSFDAEVLFIARHLGYSIIEVPVNWYFNADSRVRLVDDSLRMAYDLFTIRRNARIGLYGAKKV